MSKFIKPVLPIPPTPAQIERLRKQARLTALFLGAVFALAASGLWLLVWHWASNADILMSLLTLHQLGALVIIWVIVHRWWWKYEPLARERFWSANRYCAKHQEAEEYRRTVLEMGRAFIEYDLQVLSRFDEEMLRWEMAEQRAHEDAAQERLLYSKPQEKLPSSPRVS